MPRLPRRPCRCTMCLGDTQEGRLQSYAAVLACTLSPSLVRKRLCATFRYLLSSFRAERHDSPRCRVRWELRCNSGVAHAGFVRPPLHRRDSGGSGMPWRQISRYTFDILVPQASESRQRLRDLIKDDRLRRSVNSGTHGCQLRGLHRRNYEFGIMQPSGTCAPSAR